MQVSQKPAGPYIYGPKRRLPPEVYEDNYAYLINYYQPMIDYLDAKERGGSPKPPTLPWLCERWMDKYDTRKPIKHYDESRLSELRSRNDKRARKNLLDYRADMKRSCFSMIQRAEAARVEEHLNRVSFLERIEKKWKKRCDDLEKTIKEERTKRLQDIERKLAQATAENDREFTPSMKQALRGRDEGRIAQILFWESRKKQIDRSERENAERIYRAKQEEAWNRAHNYGAGMTGQGKWLQKNLSGNIDVMRDSLNRYNRMLHELKHIKLNDDEEE
ncbi:paramyosin, short form-like [Culicoides brevitarsis]|uniref:paramyosin, short form-like n=1 Tax=Culicoides brevitarsis TaxID=469753 RepID=UPI00307C2654